MEANLSYVKSVLLHNKHYVCSENTLVMLFIVLARILMLSLLVEQTYKCLLAFILSLHHCINLFAKQRADLLLWFSCVSINQSINQSLFVSGNETHTARPISIKVKYKTIQTQSTMDKSTIYIIKGDMFVCLFVCHDLCSV